jgi:hypothetical protein
MVCSQGKPGQERNRFFVDHQCDGDGEVNHMAWLIEDEGPAHCYYCEIAVPDAIQALLIMLIDAHLQHRGV